VTYFQKYSLFYSISLVNLKVTPSRYHFCFALIIGTDEPGTLYIRVFLSNYGKNDYSDQTFYHEDGEIATSIHPKFNRIIIWTGGVETLFRPPSMGVTNPQHSVFLKLTDDLEIFKEGFAKFTVSTFGMHFFIL